jgi:hypothetical protein
MPTPKYPLESLARLRDDEVERAGRGLASAAATRDAAQRKRQLAEEGRDRHEAGVSSVRASELGALGRGDLRVADLVQAESWGVAIAAERRRLAAEARQSEAEEKSALEGVRKAQAQVVSTRADAELIVRHRARWADAQKKAHEAADEEASFEAWRRKP